MVESRRVLKAGALAAVLAMLAACDNGPSAVAAQAPNPPLAEAPAPLAPEASRTGSDGEASVKQIDGKPMWSTTRRYSAEENAQRNFERNGQDFGASTVEEFVQKAHDFVGDPPRQALTLKRANGDLLIYDPKTNVFAVATKAGAPRTMFKPRDGRAYWDEQVEREGRRQTARTTQRSGGDES